MDSQLLQSLVLILYEPFSHPDFQLFIPSHDNADYKLFILHYDQ